MQVEESGSAYTKTSLPELKYAYTALEPVLSSEILEVHHKKHHNAYVNNYNTLMNDLLNAQKKCDLPKVVTLSQKVTFNAGGVTLFSFKFIMFEWLVPPHLRNRLTAMLFTSRTWLPLAMEEAFSLLRSLL
jgi:superoxide dismutase